MSDAASAVPAQSLIDLPRRTSRIVLSVAWAELSPPEARRLRELGVDEGVEIELVRPSGLLGGPLACRVGRMTIAVRRHVARAVRVSAAEGGVAA